MAKRQYSNSLESKQSILEFVRETGQSTSFKYYRWCKAKSITPMWIVIGDEDNPGTLRTVIRMLIRGIPDNEIIDAI